MELLERFQRASIVKEMYPEFKDFCRDAMEFLGYSLTWMQEDICDFMQYGGLKIGVMAQRGEAKSTIACIKGVWEITQNPTARVLLISGSGDKAEENATLIQGLINHWPLLSYLKPDRNAGDRSSISAFDVHWALKGVNKSPTVRCMGITASLQGYRADFLIPDDVETNKNGLTATERAKLFQLTKEFSSIVSDSNGQILYLGTPQTKDSIYNTLPQRGFTLRIWPGRFPDDDTIKAYGGALAPSILERIALIGSRCQTGRGLDGTRGWATDPERLSESDLEEKELDQGPETFELQFMLNTHLSDLARQQLRLRDLIFLDTDHKHVPELVHWAAEPRFRLDLDPSFPVVGAELYRAASTSDTFMKPTAVTMSIDPAGAGGDELAFAIGAAAGPYLHVFAWGGFLGGVSDANLEKVVKLCKAFGVSTICIEKNMGHGTVALVVQNYFNAVIDGKKRLEGVGIVETYSTGQKERRIIDTVRPVMQRHRLVMHRSAMQMDADTLQQYGMQERAVRSGFYQMQNLTSDRGSLEKDDRLDALSILVHHLQGFLVIDAEKASRKRQEAIAKEYVENPMGYSDFKTTTKRSRHRALRRRGM